MKDRKKINFFLLSILFVLSGVAALIYQVTWFKQLSYFMGNGTYAQAVVLATFMGGLAIGSWWWGKKADNSSNALRLFALLEIGIGIYCFLYEPIFSIVEFMFNSSVKSMGLASDSALVLLFRALASSSAIIVPTILMGGTLPVLVKCISDRIDQVGKNVALLYFINSLGAVLGSVLAGFYLIENFGLRITTFSGAALDFIVGVVFLILSKGWQSNNVSTESKQEVLSFSLSKKQQKIVLAIAGLSGLCAMVYEVAWLRLLIPILSSTTYSFTIILTAFITGITLGSVAVFYIFKIVRNPYLFLGYCQAAIALCIFLSIPFYEKLPYYIWKTIDSNYNFEGGYDSYLKIQFVYVFLLIFPPTIFMGMSLPIASKLLVSSVKNTGKSIGNVFSINTIGTVIGSLMAGLILIPYIGIRNTINFALLINIIMAIWVFNSLGKLNKASGIISCIFLLSGAVYYLSSIDEKSWAYNIMLSDIPRRINRKDAPKSYEEFLEIVDLSEHELLYYKEGIAGTIVVGKTPGGTHYLYTNGKADSNTSTDMQAQSSIGHFPIILHPDADSIFVIGLGAGHTIGGAMLDRDIKHAEVAEISPEVIESSQHFSDFNHKPLEDERLKLIKDDGLTALRLSPYKYDVIISQPSNIWSAGVANLFTKEFFADCKEKLKPGGYVAQWFAIYEMDDKSLKLILRTALSEFEHISLWKIGDNDVMLICSESEFDFDLEKLESNYKKVQKPLSREYVWVKSFPIFLSQQLFTSTEAIRLYAGEGDINSENHPLLELWIPEAYFMNSKPKEYLAMNEWKTYFNSDFLLRKYELTKGLTTTDKIEISSFQANAGDLGNKKFNQFWNYIDERKRHHTQSKFAENIFIGYIDKSSNFHQKDTVNPFQDIHAWSCCSKFKENMDLTYNWTDPKGKIYVKNVSHKDSWRTVWVENPAPHPMTEGTWKLNVTHRGKPVSGVEFHVDKDVPISKPDFAHQNIIVGTRKGTKINPLEKVHPMQNIVASTSGLAFGKTETVNVKWISPSGKEITQLFTYQSHYTVTWIPFPSSLPMEIGEWKVQISSLKGKVYTDTYFTVDKNTSLIN